jgi:hypothetical protein
LPQARSSLGAAGGTRIPLIRICLQYRQSGFFGVVKSGVKPDHARTSQGFH